MNIFPFPKLKNRRTGVEIELNTNPFSIGRGLCCNYVIPSKTVSRVHCVLELSSDNTWLLKDTSTNGTFVNGELIKHVSSPPLKNNDVISLELDGIDSFVFIMETPSNDISDEQLCAIADSVFNEMERLSSNPIGTADAELGATSLPARRTTPDSTALNPLLDHMYVAKSSIDAAKKARVGRSPRPILGCGNRRDSETPVLVSPPAQDSDTSRINEASTAALERVMEAPVASNVSDLNGAETATQRSRSNGRSKEKRNAGVKVSVATSRVSPLPSTGSGSDIVQESDSKGKREKKVKSSQKGGSSPRLNEGDACLAQPGPSTEKNEKPSEQPDQYEVMENELQCVICSELFVKAVTLNCSHTFCKHCIGMWNKNKSDCPICRTKITSTTSTIVLDNVIEKVIENSNEEIKEHRRTLMEERKRLEEEENRPQVQQADGAQGRGRGRGRGRQSTRRVRGGRPGNRSQDAQPRINVLDPLAINIGALANNVIELSSDSDRSSDTESMSFSDFEDEYNNDDWYDRPRPYWGGYGHCFRCGSPTHWANSCPNR